MYQPVACTLSDTKKTRVFFGLGIMIVNLHVAHDFFAHKELLEREYWIGVMLRTCKCFCFRKPNRCSTCITINTLRQALVIVKAIGGIFRGQWHAVTFWVYRIFACMICMLYQALCVVFATLCLKDGIAFRGIISKCGVTGYCFWPALFHFPLHKDLCKRLCSHHKGLKGQRMERLVGINIYIYIDVHVYICIRVWVCGRRR